MTDLGDLKFRKKTNETTFEDINEANRIYAEYTKKKKKLLDAVKTVDLRGRAADVQANFQKFVQEGGCKKPFSLTRNKSVTKVTEKKTRTAAQLLTAVSPK